MDDAGGDAVNQMIGYNFNNSLYWQQILNSVRRWSVSLLSGSALALVPGWLDPGSSRQGGGRGSGHKNMDMGPTATGGQLYLTKMNTSPKSQKKCPFTKISITIPLQKFKSHPTSDTILLPPGYKTYAHLGTGAQKA